MMRREPLDEKKIVNVDESEEEIVHTPMGTTMRKPIKVGVHVEYEGKEYVVQNLKDNDQIFIAMEDETHTVDKSEVKVIR